MHWNEQRKFNAVSLPPPPPPPTEMDRYGFRVTVPWNSEVAWPTKDAHSTTAIAVYISTKYLLFLWDKKLLVANWGEQVKHQEWPT